MTFPLLPPPPSSHVDKIVPLCLPWPWCGCGGCLLDWLPSRLMPGAQCSPSIRDAPDPFVLLVSAASRRDSENLHLVFSSLKVLLFVFWSLKDLSLPQFSSRTPVWKRNSLLIQSSLHFDCVASSSEHRLSQSNFLLSDIEEFFGEPSHPLQISHIKKWVKRTGISQLEKS